MSSAIMTVDIPGVSKFISGKVREVFDLGASLLVVATDRISAFDVILPTGIPDKGRVLTQLSRFWFERTADLVPNHYITTEIAAITSAITAAGGTVTPALAKSLAGRSMLVKRANALPIECVARGYIAGSLWKEYKAYFAHGGTVSIHGVPLPVGLRESDELPETIFTPATKAHSGHDENVSFAAISKTVGGDLAEQLKDLTLKLYGFAANFALDRGVMIADTKFEFGTIDGVLTVIDEVLTPDSSRFWDRSIYKPGRPQASFDKQFVRDYLETLDWNKTYPGPCLPEDVIEKTAGKYRDAYQRITGSKL